jgi:Patatin-like phospholipase
MLRVRGGAAALSAGRGTDFRERERNCCMWIMPHLGGRPVRVRRRLALALCAVALAGCASAPRIPYTQQEDAFATVPGFPGARIWADDPTLGGTRRSPVTRIATRQQPLVLALSGGGPDGAFGAGLLTGWSARGTRPQFTIVTGASAGALIAPFAFLGPAYDETLRSVFGSGELANLLQSDVLAGLFGTSLFKTAPLRELIARHVDETILAAVAKEHASGRRLYIVTTNLDAQRTSIWDMGRIAASGNPQALELFRNVMTASASIPGVFSPMLIEVESQGRRFAEMHVDGGVTTNVLVVPDSVLVFGTPLFPPNALPKVYIVMNGKLSPNFDVVRAATLPIVTRAFETSVHANSRSTLLASYQFMKARNWEFNLASIDPDYPQGPNYGFDAAYMQGLFDYGYQRGRSGVLWQRSPAEFRLQPSIPQVAGR